MAPADLADLAFGALTLWREARGQPRAGKAAVAYTFIRRGRVPAWWNGHVPHSIASVIAQPMQYSSITDPHDPQLAKYPRTTDPEWCECVDVLEKVIAGTEPDPAPGADSYFAVSIPAPKWATDDKFIAQVGAHRFYRVLT